MGNFAPKTPVQLDPPKEDPFTKDELAKYDGKYIHIFCIVTICTAKTGVVRSHYLHR